MADRMTYAGVGVDYDAMDPFKREAQKAGLATADNLKKRGLEEVEWTRGESVHLVHDPARQCYWGHVHEGLGTKNLVADAMDVLTGKPTHYFNIGQSALAVGLNDAATLGVRPTTVTMHLAVGSSDWFNNEGRTNSLINGWTFACKRRAGCTWAGGETPTLKDILLPTASELSCSVVGIIEPEGNLIDGNIPHGAAIVLLGSSGIHDNGLTLGRRIGEQVAGGYLRPLEDGMPYGEALLQPTVFYGPTIEACQDAGIKIHYTVNITGHGWRKLMRSPKPLHYVIERIPEPQPVFRFIQEHGNVDTAEMYGNFNMGAGFAVYVDEKDAQQVIDIAREFGIEAMKAGFIDAGLRQRDDPNEKKVVIEPLKLEWTGKTLGVR